MRLLIILFAIVSLLTPITYAQSTPTWRQILEVKGTATKQTDLFEVKGSKWRIRWQKPDAEVRLTITVYDKDGIPIDMIASKAATKDESYIHKPGTFYLSINASDSYAIVVEDWR